MDYHRPLNESEDNPQVHIALLLVPGKHEGPKKFSKSPLLLNPGGPGGSGVTFALGFGDRIHKIVGEDQDVIGFDPRGIEQRLPELIASHTHQSCLLKVEKIMLKEIFKDFCGKLQEESLEMSTPAQALCKCWILEQGVLQSYAKKRIP